MRREAGHLRPLHRTVVAVDIDSFSQRTVSQQVRLRAVLYRALTAALRSADVPDHAFHFVDRGDDGVLILIDPEAPKNRLVADFLPHLATILRTHNAGEAVPLRVRIAVHAGEVVMDEYGMVGDAMHTVLLLLASAEMRSGLRLVDADLVVGVSEPIYESVIEPGYRGIDPAAYRRVLAEVRGTREPVWIWLPGVTGPRPDTRTTRLRGPGDLLHRSILVADIEDSDSRPDNIKWLHRDRLRSVLFDAIDDAGISTDQYAAKDTGDGWRVLFTAGTAKNRLAGPLISALARRLVAYNADAPAGAHMRLRVVLHAGEVLRDGSDYFGSSLNETCWMADSEELRECLRGSTAPMVLMVSDVIYNGVVRHGYGEISPDAYQPCTVNAKKRQVSAWVCWPDPTGED